MAIDDINGLYDSNIKTSHKKRSLAQKIGTYVVAGGLLFASAPAVYSQEKSGQFDVTQYLKDDLAKYKKTETAAFIAAGVALAASWISLVSPKADNFRNLCAGVFFVSGSIGLYSFSQGSNGK